MDKDILEMKPTIYLKKAAATGNQGRRPLGRANDLVTSVSPHLSKLTPAGTRKIARTSGIVP